MHVLTALRYGLWAGIVATADSNRRHYGMTTTWLPHLLTNTVTLLLPEVLRLLPIDNKLSESSAALPANVQVAYNTLRSVTDDPQYGVYVAPLAGGYLLSHPDFNIYKGSMGEATFAGFGLDAIPHSSTAFALTALVGKATQTVDHTSPALLARLLRWGQQRPAVFSALVLALATLVWETGEYRIHKHELALRGNDSEINMQWSVRDTVFDCFSNAIGWGLAVVWQRGGRH